MSRRNRTLLVFVHAAVSVAWLGAGAANVVLAVTAGSTGELELRRACYVLIERLDSYLVIPLAFAALLTGVVLSLVTPWGLTRYWWVLVKFVLTIVVIVYSTFGVGVWVAESIESMAAGATKSPVAERLVYGASINIIAFLFMTWASTAKPWGTTPWSATPPRSR